MTKELPNHIYHKEDIDRAFNWGVQTGLAVFEKSLGMSFDNQKYVLDRVKNMLMEDKAAAVLWKE